MFKLSLKESSYFLFVFCVWFYYLIILPPRDYLLLFYNYCIITMILFWIYLIIQNKAFLTKNKERLKFLLLYNLIYIIVLFLFAISNNTLIGGQITFQTPTNETLFGIFTNIINGLYRTIFNHFGLTIINLTKEVSRVICISCLCSIVIVNFFNKLYKTIYRR